MELNSSPSTLFNIVTEAVGKVKADDCKAIAEFLNQHLEELEIQSREEEEEECRRGPNTSGWGTLPSLILERIYSYLTVQQRYYASCTCLAWYHAFNLTRPWASFVMSDTTLCRRRFDYGERSWRHILDHHRAQQLITHIGPYLRSLTLTPRSFFGLFAHYHFMNHLSSYAERYQVDPTSVQGCSFKITHFRFEFFCDIASSSPRLSDRYVIGTGGDILTSLKRLIGNLNYLTRLDLIDLLLVPEDAVHLLDDACAGLCERLEVLTLINATKDHFTLLHPGAFVSLRVLHISPQSLGEELLELLPPSLEQLHIIQNSYGGMAEPVEARVWQKIAGFARFQVFLRTVSRSVDKEMVWQERAPVVSVLYDCPLSRMSLASTLTVIQLYAETLGEYGHLGLPRFRSSRSFPHRVDAMLLALCRRCSYLHTLYVRDLISTSTALLIVSHSPNLRNFFVRRNGLLKRIDYPQMPSLHLDHNFAQWIRLNGASYERSEREIGRMLGSPSWRFMSDKDFKLACSRRRPY